MLVRFFFFQAEDGIRDLVRSRGLGDVYKRQVADQIRSGNGFEFHGPTGHYADPVDGNCRIALPLSLIHI